MKKKIKMDFRHQVICTLCAKNRGGAIPKGLCCTVWTDKCPYCKKVKTVVPTRDFRWPGQRTMPMWD